MTIIIAAKQKEQKGDVHKIVIFCEITRGSQHWSPQFEDRQSLSARKVGLGPSLQVDGDVITLVAALQQQHH